LIDLTNIYNKSRYKILDLINVGKIVNQGFLSLNQDEIYYGGSVIESSYDSSGLKSNIANNIDIDDLKLIMDKKYEKPVAYDYAAMWANLK